VIPPGTDDDLSFFQPAEDLQLQALVSEFYSEMVASLQASAMLLPWASCTSIWRSLAMICSELNLFFGILGSVVPGQFSRSTWSNSTQSGHLGKVAGLYQTALLSAGAVSYLLLTGIQNARRPLPCYAGLALAREQSRVGFRRPKADRDELMAARCAVREHAASQKRRKQPASRSTSQR
jgi:hypothetical protein